MSSKSQAGFSLVELIVVFTIIGIIATLTMPQLIRAINAAENGNANATMRTIVSAQYSFYAQHKRYGRLDEINAMQLNAFGTVTGGSLQRGNILYQMDPNPTPTDAELKDNFKVKATRVGTGGQLPLVITVDQSGEVVQILP